MARAFGGQRGFSAIELLVVISVALIVGAMALPQITDMVARSSLNGAVTSVSGIIQTARLKAMSEGLPFRVSFLATTKTYTLARCVDCTSTTTTETYTTVSGYSAIPFAPSAGVVLGSDLTLYVRPGGALQTTVGTSTCPTVTTMTLRNGSRTRTISVGCYGKITVA